MRNCAALTVILALCAASASPAEASTAHATPRTLKVHVKAVTTNFIDNAPTGSIGPGDELLLSEVATRAELDITSAAAVEAWPWQDYELVLNAAAYTAVDLAETPAGRADAWAANAVAPALLARAATEHRLTLVHISSDYVFDGVSTDRDGHTEDEPLSPLGVYGQSKAAGDIAVSTTPRHYLLRTSWVIGEGHNFVRTMARLAGNGVSPSVVADQVGRLTFTSTLASAIAHLVGSGAPYGTYNVSNGGEPLSWQQIAARVFELSGRSGDEVAATTTEEYFAGAVAAGKPVSPRPLNSVLSLDKIRATGFEPEDQLVALEAYLV